MVIFDQERYLRCDQAYRFPLKTASRRYEIFRLSIAYEIVA